MIDLVAFFYCYALQSKKKKRVQGLLHACVPRVQWDVVVEKHSSMQLFLCNILGFSEVLGESRRRRHGSALGEQLIGGDVQIPDQE